MSGKFPTYKGKPLVRSGDTLYYGDMHEPYVAKIDIKTKKTVKDMEVADKVNVQIIATDPTTPPAQMIAKRADVEGLYAAIDFADSQFERLASKTKKPEAEKAEA